MPLGGDSTMVEVRTTGWFFLDADKATPACCP